MKKDSELKFNINIYSFKGLESAVNLYKDFAKFEINIKKKYFEVGVSLIDKEMNFEEIENEFKNCVLFMSINL